MHSKLNKGEHQEIQAWLWSCLLTWVANAILKKQPRIQSFLTSGDERLLLLNHHSRPAVRSLRTSSPGRSVKCWLVEMTLVMTSLPLARVFRSFPLRSDWRKSDRSFGGEPQGNWGLNSHSRDVVASFPFFSRRQSVPERLLPGYAVRIEYTLSNSLLRDQKPCCNKFYNPGTGSQ